MQYCGMLDYSMMMFGNGMYYDPWFFEMEVAPELATLANSSGSESACDVVWTDSNGNNVGEGMEISG